MSFAGVSIGATTGLVASEREVVRLMFSGDTEPPYRQGTPLYFPRPTAMAGRKVVGVRVLFAPPGHVSKSGWMDLAAGAHLLLTLVSPAGVRIHSDVPAPRFCASPLKGAGGLYVQRSPILEPVEIDLLWSYAVLTRPLAPGERSWCYVEFDYLPR